MLSLLKLGLSEFAEKDDFGSFNHITGFRGHFFFWGENTRHLYDKNEPILGSSGEGVCTVWSPGL